MKYFTMFNIVYSNEKKKSKHCSIAKDKIFLKYMGSNRIKVLHYKTEKMFCNM